MYTNDKKIRITLRLNEEQFDYVKANSDVLGTTPSEFLRMVINSAMFATKNNLTDENYKKMIGGQRRENEQTNLEHKL